jgi:predicted Zn finger-like uncharacterized protein
MYTQCPECLTIYALDAGVLAQSHGSVRCGQCTMVFDALPSLSETLPPEHFAGLPARAPGAESPLLVDAVFRPVPEAVDGADPDEVAAPVVAHATPAFARPRAPRKRAADLRWIAGCGVLALLLVAQLVWANRASFADTGLRPMLVRVCATLSCTLPPLKDVGRLTLLSRDIRPHPSVPGALIISATIRNDADFTQPYPVIRIALSDLDGNAIAMRRFRPSEYIGDPKTLTAGLPPGGTVAAVFEVEDPGKNAVAFEFAFE